MESKETIFYFNTDLSMKNIWMIIATAISLIFFISATVTGGYKIVPTVLMVFLFYKTSVGIIQRKTKLKNKAAVTIGKESILVDDINTKIEIPFAEIERMELVEITLQIFIKEREKPIFYDFANIKKDERNAFTEQIKNLGIKFNHETS